MARNEKKYFHRPLAKRSKAQSALECALLFPFLVAMILGIFELALMWSQYNTMELVVREISANLAVTDDMKCVSEDSALAVIEERTSVLQGRRLEFTQEVNENVITFTSTDSFRGTPFVEVRINCSPNFNNSSVQSAPSVQLRAIHMLHFFSASLPNFRTGERIVIIPDNVVFTSTKVISLSRI